ncbi:Conserved hypothetical ATP binding protein [Babesia microti strain RI]|uniref:GPN-loop GTPase 3 n=1 Tax=Babesia microti (strain RI) TaxID=1133968 RepID=I7I7W4_BABMR|nr:Conserved hypothetical ATP binding protein [Babesia microti strain RI]CCF72693.1 Conserved hypothetical ATP binding protein [Babesia microti strain RI]|eukprot:XP_012647302.1 Conserved hypothetical ATP binding protein [Babesia microti strain RI]
MRYAHLVIGPAGSGKTTYCRVMQEHFESIGRTCHIVNLDPASEEGMAQDDTNTSVNENKLNPYDTDIRDLVNIGDIISYSKLGPNGALIKCSEILQENIDWLYEEIESSYGDETILLFDTPGQIELFTHLSYVRDIVSLLKRLNINAVALFLLDVSFLGDPSKLVAGSLAGLAAMANLETPHVNVVTKCDLLESTKSENNKSYGVHVPSAFMDITSSSYGLSNNMSLKHSNITKSLDKNDVENDGSKYNPTKIYSTYNQDSTFSAVDFCEVIANQNPDELLSALSAHLPRKFQKLNEAYVQMLSDFNLVSFISLNYNDPDSIEKLIFQTDIAIQFGEEAEPMMKF